MSVPTAAILCARKDFEYLSSNKSAIIEIQDETTTVPPKQATVEKNIVGKTLEAIKTAVGDKL